MKILAIESSCDETAAAVVEDGRRVLSSVVASQVDEHKLYGGVVPEIASRRHVESISQVVEQAVGESGCGLNDIDAIAVTYAPGLIGALLVGVNFAKGLAFALKKPLVPVHHLRSHIGANYLCHYELEPPFLCLVVSGGHSHIVEVLGYTEFKIVGQTRDDAAGEALDKAARALGLPYPGGLHMDMAARGGDDSAYKLPQPHVTGSPYDFSFSGLKTAVLNLIHNCEQRGETVDVKNMAASYQNAVTGLLANNFVKAAEDKKYSKLVMAGGVCANSSLRAKMKAGCDERGWSLYMPDISLCGDNAAMVGAQGYYEFLAGAVAGTTLNAFATMNIEKNLNWSRA